MSRQRFVVVDIETTGNAPRKGNKIIQIAAVVVEEGKIIDRYMSFVNPEQEIPVFIEQLTGISNDLVKDAPTFAEIAEEISSIIKDSYFVAHNVYFDFSFLQEELKQAGFEQLTCPILDTVELSRVMFPTANGYKLTEICGELNIEYVNPHRADNDAEVTASLLLTILKKIENLPSVTLQQLERLSKSFISDLDELLSEIISDKLITLTHGKNNEQIEICRKLAIKKKEDLKNDKEDIIQEDDDFSLFLDSVLNEDSKLKDAIPFFEVRNEQKRIAAEIMDSFLTYQHMLIEAGTGTGKTLAYLIPAIYYAKKIKKRIIISTYTINLQAQIMEKEIPLLKSIMPFSFQAAILKGQKNYLCLHKFEQALYENNDNYDEILTKAQILIWLTETETGDVDELNIPSGGKMLWDRISYDSFVSNHKKNPYYEKCFYKHARKNAENAHILITNHAMLLADLAREGEILKPYEQVIVDEAHHLESVASEHLGHRLNYVSMHLKLSRLGTMQSDGILKQVYEIVRKRNEASVTDFSKIEKLLSNYGEDSDLFFTSLHSYVLNKRKNPSVNRITYRFSSSDYNNRTWDSLLELIRRMIFSLLDLTRLMEKHKLLLEENEQFTMNGKERQLLIQYIDIQSFLLKFKQSLQYLFLETDERFVTWIEIEAKGAKNAVSVYTQPVSVTDFLADSFFTHKKSVILTSATLTVNNSFQYFIEQLGLTDFYPKQLKLESPFDYERQVKLLVPSDMPSVSEVDTDEYVEAVTANISTIAQITDGKLLVLFTAYDMLRKTYELLKEDVTLDEFIIMGQGTSSGSRSKLMKTFKQFNKGILLGTNSFWEGIDFQGEDLTALIIVRLPFSAPDDPIVSAKCEYMKKNGKVPFLHYSLPEAIIRFKQGFGRLIRSRRDRGLLFVFDKRIITTDYGKSFIQSVPKMDLQVKEMSELTHIMEAWKDA
ncbi:ATP-dependent DNA helicase DinG [Metabacillus fastidiosus]|uniref:ATP-dependent DNA helicase DinG n=1 Tax=Metabacillus fastidiosus TaxID=1458 RepID=UPI002E216DC7|nr:ATP-dependent DNA helicase DinG [Metabacillus fastidiosus]MED4532158.1 ATP-dependent DNA helicase DinG [Metabacillus fastidiosus]